MKMLFTWRPYPFLFGLVLTTFALSCQKNVETLKPNAPGEAVTPDQPKLPIPGAITAVAVPQGTMTTALIGPAGGHLESDDKRLHLDIPPGALTTSQTITIQPLDKNHCPGGTATVFRLLPHGLTFSKPAQLTFNYQQEDVEGTAAELLRIAYQTDQQGWQSIPTVRLDTTHHQVIGQTTHFSDWTVLKSVIIDPKVNAVDPGGSLQLTVRGHMDLSDPSSDLGVPIVVPIENKYIKRWAVQGGGQVDDTGNSTTTYTAPDKIPPTNPVTVTVLVSTKINNVQKEVRLKAKVYIMGEGLVFRINGGPWIPTTSPLGLSRLQRGSDYYMTVQTGSVVPGQFASVTLSWPVKASQQNMTSYSLPWQLKTKQNEPAIPVLYLATSPSGQPLYTFFYEQNKQAFPSPGELRIDYPTTDIGGYFIGSFTLKRAGIVEYKGGTDPMFDGTADVEGRFRLKLARTL